MSGNRGGRREGAGRLPGDGDGPTRRQTIRVLETQIERAEAIAARYVDADTGKPWPLSRVYREALEEGLRVLEEREA